MVVIYLIKFNNCGHSFLCSDNGDGHKSTNKLLLKLFYSSSYIKGLFKILSCAQLVSFMRWSMWMRGRNEPRQDDLLRRVYLTS